MWIPSALRERADARGYADDPPAAFFTIWRVRRRRPRHRDSLRLVGQHPGDLEMGRRAIPTLDRRRLPDVGRRSRHRDRTARSRRAHRHLRPPLHRQGLERFLGAGHGHSRFRPSSWCSPRARSSKGRGPATTSRRCSASRTATETNSSFPSAFRGSTSSPTPADQLVTSA